MKEVPKSYLLGWSHTRYSTFEQCQRRYFHEYYTGWDPDHSNKAWELYKLTSVPLEIGSIFHKVCDKLLKRLRKSNAPVDHEKLADYVQNLVTRECAGKTFAEVYYKQKADIDHQEEIETPVLTAIWNLLNSDRFDWLINQSAESKALWHIEHSTEGYYGLCQIDGLKAYCKVDFLFPHNEHLVILDWKTGKPDRKKHRSQMKGYALWALFHQDKPLDHIVPILAYVLPEYKEEVIELNDYDIIEFTKLVHEQTLKLYSFCSNVDRNLPVPKENFKLTQQWALCSHCKYRELCDRV